MLLPVNQRMQAPAEPAAVVSCCTIMLYHQAECQSKKRLKINTLGNWWAL
jgi:hypothetical protein